MRKQPLTSKILTTHAYTDTTHCNAPAVTSVAPCVGEAFAGDCDGVVLATPNLCAAHEEFEHVCIWSEPLQYECSSITRLLQKRVTEKLCTEESEASRKEHTVC